MEAKETIQEDHVCAICLTVYYKPVQIPACKHIFCENCLTEAALISQTNRCPLCRGQLNVQTDVVPLPELSQQMQKQYPTSIALKKKTIKERTLARFLIGNTTRTLNTNEDNKYQWTIFVKPVQGDKNLSETIEKIDVKLHPTFHPSIISTNITGNKIVEVKRLGWGTFRIGIVIFWKGKFEEKQSELYHDLEFVQLKQNIVHTTLTIKSV